ncbi:MAG: glycerol-3-phosphate 1-O-acyltransferase PlsY [Cyanobacteria bacterium P01_F01_bin.150]
MGTLWAGIIGVLSLAYLLGSLPTGYLVARQLKGIDIREHGSGSTGATNVLRTLGKGPGLFVFLVDIGKGVAAILLARGIGERLTVQLDSLSIWVPVLTVLAGTLAIVGHSRSVWLGFKGGKSVATGLGIMFALHWPTGLISFGMFGLMLALFRIVSIGSIVGAIAVPVSMIAMGQPLAYEVFAILAAFYIINRHRSNIQRLFAGTEPRIGQKLAESADAS